MAHKKSGDSRRPGSGSEPVSGREDGPQDEAGDLTDLNSGRINRSLLRELLRTDRAREAASLLEGSSEWSEWKDKRVGEAYRELVGKTCPWINELYAGEDATFDDLVLDDFPHPVKGSAQHAGPKEHLGTEEAGSKRVKPAGKPTTPLERIEEDKSPSGPRLPGRR